MSRYRVKPRLSQRDIRNHLRFLAGETDMEQSVKRGRQKEGLTNDAIAEWRKLHPNLLLERNKRRLATPPGMSQPIMLGWMAEGSPDWVGYLSVTITPAMLNRRVAIFCGIEAKRADGGVVSGEQEAFINAASDAGAIAGVARNAEDAEAVLTRWLEKVTADER